MERVAPSPELPTGEKVSKRGDPRTGLTWAEAEAKLRECGRNEVTQAPPTFLALLLAQLRDPLLVLVLLCAVAALVANIAGPLRGNVLYYIPCAVMFLVALANASVAAWREHERSRAAQRASSEVGQASARVLREGKQSVLPAALLVPGDVVLLSAGDVVPADVLLIEEHHLRVVELCVTGETYEVVKEVASGPADAATDRNSVLSGCYVTGGTARGYVTGTGDHTWVGQVLARLEREEGRIARILARGVRDRAAHRQSKVADLGCRTAFGVVLGCTVLFVVGMAAHRDDIADPDDPLWLHMLLGALALAVHALPHALATCGTVALSSCAASLADLAIWVQRPTVVDSLSSLSFLCLGTTGTLTSGRAAALSLWSGGLSYMVGGIGPGTSAPTISREGSEAQAGGEPGVSGTLFAALLCCRTGTIPEHVAYAIAQAAQAADLPLEAAVTSCPSALEVLYRHDRKVALVVASVAGRDCLGAAGAPLPPEGVNFLVACLGAHEEVLPFCTERLLADGQTAPLDEAARAEALRIAEAHLARSATVLLVATRALSQLAADAAAPGSSHLGEMRQGLRLVGLLACVDAERQGAAQAVLAAQRAGIGVALLTGDALPSAVAAARRAGILGSDVDAAEAALDCSRLRPKGSYLPEAELDALVHPACVFAGAVPGDRVYVLHALRRRGPVAMVSAETIDERALSVADVGVAMGVQGTQVAKASAGMVLTGDDLTSVPDAVQTCRALYAAFRSLAAFWVSVSAAAILQLLVCVSAGLPTMRTPLQMLFLIPAADVPALCALRAGPRDAAAAAQQPRRRDGPLLLGWMWVSALANALLLAGVVLVVYILALLHYCDGYVHQDTMRHLPSLSGRLACARSAALLCFAWCAHARAVTARSFREPAWRDLGGLAATLKAVAVGQLVLYAGLLVPFVSDEVLQLRGSEMGAFGWLSALIGAAAFLLLSEACKPLVASRAAWCREASVYSSQPS